MDSWIQWPDKEHNTTGEYCWCEPRIERYPEGNVIIHNSIDEFFEQDFETEKPKQEGH